MLFRVETVVKMRVLKKMLLRASLALFFLQNTLHVV